MMCKSQGRNSADPRQEGYVTAWSGDLGWDLPPDMPTMLLPLPDFAVPEDPVERAKDPYVLRAVLHAIRKRFDSRIPPPDS